MFRLLVNEPSDKPGTIQRGCICTPMFDLRQVLPVFVMPTALTLLFVVAGLRLRRRYLIWIGVIILWLSSTPILSSLLMRAAEGWAVGDYAVHAQAANAIVVLSGDADRFFGGIELMKAGKAPLLVFTGGWSPLEPKATPEGDISVQWAKELGIPADRLATTGKVSTTAEEAAAVAALLRRRQAGSTDGAATGNMRILLVTSAFHMRRAQVLFGREGITTIPFPVNFHVSAGSALSVGSFLPNARSLSQTEIALHEVYGQLFYLVVAR